MFIVVKNWIMWKSNKEQGKFGFWWLISNIIAPCVLIVVCVGLLAVAWTGSFDFDMNEATQDARYWLDAGIPDESLRLTYLIN